MFRTSIGRKAIVAVTGVLLFGFLIVHMAGNLLIYEGPSAINGYGQKLRDTGPLLWVARLGLLALAVVHVWFTILLTIENRAARPVGYSSLRPQRSTAASRTMILSGLFILVFIVYHILHFTMYLVNPNYAGLGEHGPDGRLRHDVFSMVQDAFSNLGVVAIYVVAMLLLASHLSHGLKSLVQTLGLSNKRLAPIWAKAGPAVAVLLVLGFLSVPLGVFLGLVRPPPAPMKLDVQPGTVKGLER